MSRCSILQKLRLLLAREPRVEHAPGALGAVPIAAGRGLRVLGRARLEEVRVLDAVQNLREPRQRMLADLEELRQAELLQAPVRDVADVGLDLLGVQPRDRPELEREVDEAVLEPDDRARTLDDVLAHALRERAGLGRKRVE